MDSYEISAVIDSLAVVDSDEFMKLHLDLFTKWIIMTIVDQNTSSDKFMGILCSMCILNSLIPDHSTSLLNPVRCTWATI